MTALNPKYIEMVDKENSKVGHQPNKKDKNCDELPVKKTVLGETNQQVFLVEEPSSPEDTKLLNRKREMQQKAVTGGFALKLQFC